VRLKKIMLKEAATSGVVGLSELLCQANPV